MTILYLISSEGYYGAESMLVSLARAASRIGHRCLVAAFCDSRFGGTEVAEEARRQGLEVKTVACNGRLDWGTVGRIRRLLTEHGVDVLHTHGYKADLYGYAASLPGRVALVSTCHNWPGKHWTMRSYAALDRLVLRRFDSVAAVSDAVARTLHSSGVKGALTVANGVDVERFAEARPALRRRFGAPGDRLVGFVGRMVPEKGGAHLLLAAPAVLGAHPAAKFVLVGDGPARGEWEALAARLGISGRVVFAGVQGDMPSVYASLDLVVLPSLVEGMPMCLLEAMAARRAVVATRVGSIPGLVKEGRTGLLVAPGDEQGLSAALVRLLSDGHLARRMGEQAHARASLHFSADAMARRYAALYHEALEKWRVQRRSEPVPA